ncbi:MAG: acylphosphatase [Chlamydiota bacterium]
MKGVLAIFQGKVQGVGFRFTVCRLAQRFSITGYVKNLANGTVEIQAFGQEEDLKTFLDLIQTQTPGQIEDVIVSPLDGKSSYKEFTAL